MTGRAIQREALTDVGRARERNEDSYYAGEYVFAVADGLGGHNAGDVASRLAVEPIAAFDRTVEGTPDDRLAEALERAVDAANRAVYQRAQSDAKVRGMGTTLTAVAIANGSAHLAHVGDSRCYLMRGGEISQLSSDHTLVARMVAEGKLTPEQAETHPQRSILTRALGAEPDVDVDTLEIQLLTGDRLLLCSDGLSSVIGDEQILATLADSKGLKEACKRLIDAANDRGGPDNITVVVVEVTGEAAVRSAGSVVAPPRREISPAPAARRDRRRIPVRPIAWILAVVVLGLGAWLGVRAWVNRSYFVGVSEGVVAIYRGLPTEFAGIELNHVEERTVTPVDQVAERWRSQLEDGIPADSLTEAREIVGRVTATPGATPTPTPTAT
ncbi:MAG: Stp1/IreP family PP2C-type Ser/Thr phosphatase [Actinomycetota bacterium]